jgi:hypothetical protein
MWVACAKRPLLVDELQEAIAFSIEDHQWSAEKIPNNMDRLFRACGNLISVDNETQLVSNDEARSSYIFPAKAPTCMPLHTRRWLHYSI